MKRKYEKPNMDLEMFEANEYIAACACSDEKYPKKNIYKSKNLLDGTLYEVHKDKNCNIERPSSAKKGYILTSQEGWVSGYYWTGSRMSVEVDKEGREILLADIHFANHS